MRMEKPDQDVHAKLSRPHFIYLGLVYLTLFATAVFASQAFAKEWNFDVYLDQSKIGQHTFSFKDNHLSSKAKFNVKVLFIQAYQYDHQSDEQWQGDCLQNLVAHTVENKAAFRVNGQLAEDKFIVNDGKATYSLPVCSMTFAYWNPKILTQTQLLNPQNAEWLDTHISKLGLDSIEVKGKKIEANRYRIDGTLAGKQKLKIELWYTADNDWVALRSTTPEGYIINYKLR
jgi:hypothetical protein